MTADRIGDLFWARVSGTIREMRSFGLSDTQIACLLSDIRAAAIQEERLRAETVYRANPPVHPTWVEVEEQLREWSPAR